MRSPLAFLRARAVLVATCTAMLVPLVVTKRPPMQDFPVHLATLRVLHDFHDPAFGFDRVYELTLGRTQYLGFYAAGHVLAYVVGVRAALLVLVGATLVGSLLGLRALLAALDRDEALAYLAVPALYGPLFALGLLPFLVAIPPLLFGVATLVKRAREPTLARHAAVAAFGVALFYLHVLHLGVFVLAALVLFPYRAAPRERALAAASLLPAAALAAWWVAGTNVGRRILDVGAHWGASNRPPLLLALADLDPWLADSYRDPSDEIVMSVVIACAAAATLLVYRERAERRLPLRWYAVVPAACFLFYVTGERERGAIWPLAQRWVLVTALFAVPLLAMPRSERARRALRGGAVLAAWLAAANATWHFVAFREETRGLDAAFDAIGDGKRVAMLAYDRTARLARFEPLMHAISYYQAEHGGVVAFSFAGFDHWPFTFARGKYPIWDGPFTPRWESHPEVAAAQPLAEGFDAVLVRDRGGRPPPRGFRLAWHEGRWEVFEKERP